MKAVGKNDANAKAARDFVPLLTIARKYSIEPIPNNIVRTRNISGELFFVTIPKTSVRMSAAMRNADMQDAKTDRSPTLGISGTPSFFLIASGITMNARQTSARII